MGGHWLLLVGQRTGEHPNISPWSPIGPIKYKLVSLYVLYVIWFNVLYNNLRYNGAKLPDIKRGMNSTAQGGGEVGVEICEVLWSSTGISKNDLKTFASLKLLAQTWQIAKLGFPQGVHDFETKNYVLPYGLGLSMSALVKF